MPVAGIDELRFVRSGPSNIHRCREFSFALARLFCLFQLGEIERAVEDSNKWSIWLDGGIHAREHITPATVIYVADQVR